MKYSFFSSACTWFPSALIIAVSASGASSAPLASCVRYVPVNIYVDKSKTHQWKTSQHLFIQYKKNASDLFYLYV